MKKALFIDRDGTIIIEPEDEQIDSLEKFRFLPKVITSLARICAGTDYELVLVSNQDGLGTPSFPEDTFWPVQNLMLQILKDEGVVFSAIHIDRTLPEQKAETRKPGTGMLKKYLDGNYDLESSFVIGDRKSDIQLAKNLGCAAILVGTKRDKNAILSTTDWQEICEFIINQPRIARITRKTSETNIAITLNLDGRGKSRIKCQLGFLKHMLDLLTKHGKFDLEAIIKGDLEVDEHHTVEDTGIVLGQAFSKALGLKKGIERYGFLLPMDESHAQVAVDFSGRSHLTWQVKFHREKIGEMPTELFQHFFKSFTDYAGCNLYIKAKGKNEHHKIEAIFKAFAQTLRGAVQKNRFEGSIPSTKGLL